MCKCNLPSTFSLQVADFGLAKFTSDTNTHVSTRVMGTFGYVRSFGAILSYLILFRYMYSSISIKGYICTADIHDMLYQIAVLNLLLLIGI
jgi:hypothetical protein